MSVRDYLTIGEVVERLQGSFPDLSISKVRFLEEEGLISPERTAGGYRKFRQPDLVRLEMILRLQREHFLPLAIIRERLADYDRGKMPPELRGVSAVAAATPGRLVEEETGPLLLEETQAALGVPASFIRELAEFGLVEIASTEDGPAIDRADAQIVHATWDLRRFGVEPRHLRMYETFAEREAAFFSQILMPTIRHRTPETRQKLSESLSELERLTGELKAHLLGRSLKAVFDDLE